MAWRRRHEPIVMQPPIAHQNGQSVWLYKRPLCRRISDFFSSATKTTSSLTLRWYRDPTLKSLSSWIWTSCSNQLAHSVIPCRYPVRSKKALREEQISAQRCCKCMPESPARWWHSRWVCVTLGKIPRWRCTQRSWMLRLRVFQSCLSALADSFLFRERLHPLRPPVFFLSGICEKKTVSRGFERAVTSELTLASMPTCLAVTAEGESIRPSSSLNMIRVPPLWATWSRWVRVMQIRWQPFFLAAFSGGQGGVIGHCDWPCPLTVIHLRSSSASWQLLSKSSGSNGLRWGARGPAHLFVF